MYINPDGQCTTPRQWQEKRWYVKKGTLFKIIYLCTVHAMARILA